MKEISPIQSDQFIHLIEGIKNFANLKENWNNEFALPVTESAIVRTVRLLHVLRRRGILRHYDDSLHIEDEYVSYGYISFEPSSEGGIEIYGGFDIMHFEVTIPPEQDSKICYKGGYVETDDKPLPEYVGVDEEYTKDYEKIADIIDNYII